MGNNNVFKVCVTVLAVILFAAIVYFAVRAGGDDDGGKELASDPGQYEHVFGELTPALKPSQAAGMNQEKPDIDASGENLTITAPSEPDDIIDQESLGDTSGIEYLKGHTETGAVLEIIDGITYVDGYIIANKTFGLPSDYVPKARISLEGVKNSTEGLTEETWEAWQELLAASAQEGLDLWIASGYRSYAHQEGLWNNYAARDGAEQADTYSARAGHSEHQTAWCFDLNSVTDAFADTAEGKWVNSNCWKYGFIIRYPKGKSDVTGYKYESWHLRYVGKELAEELYNGGDWITMEEHFGLTSRYAD